MTDAWRVFFELLQPFHDQACATARRLSRSTDEGDDLFHEAILRAFEKLGGLRDRERFKPWFYAVLVSVHRSRARRGFWRRFLSLDQQMESGRDWRDERSSATSEERAAAARAAGALARLPAEQREAIVLHEIDGFPVEEIARMQSVTVSAVKSRLARGRQRLRREYEKPGGLGITAGKCRERTITEGAA